MPSAIGGLTPEYRGADIRCGLNERLGCGPSRRSASSHKWPVFAVRDISEIRLR